jgi:SAM-dependent methyltransferase
MPTLNHETKRELYDAYFRTRFAYDPRRDLVWAPVCRYIQEKHIPDDSRIVDLGAGYCNFINNVTGSSRHAVDLFTKLADYAAPGVVPHIGSSTDMSFFDDDSFDVAFASNLMEHLSRDDMISTLFELRRILRPDGTLILLQPNFKYCSRTYFDDYTHIQIFTDASLLDFLEAYDFTVIKSYPKFLPVNMKSTLRLQLPMLPTIVAAYLRSPYKPRAGQLLMVSRNAKGRSQGAGEVR